MIASSIGYIASTPSIASISTIFITSDLMAGSFWDTKKKKKRGSIIIMNCSTLICRIFTQVIVRVSDTQENRLTSSSQMCVSVWCERSGELRRHLEALSLPYTSIRDSAPNLPHQNITRAGHVGVLSREYYHVLEQASKDYLWQKMFKEKPEYSGALAMCKNRNAKNFIYIYIYFKQCVYML